MLCTSFPELGVLEIKQGRLLGPHGWIIGEQSYLLPEHSWHGMDISNMEIPLHLEKAEKISGSTLTLASDWSSGNYGHLILDSVSRFHLFKQAGYSINDIDKVYFPFGNAGVVSSLAKQLGIPLSKCIFTPFKTEYSLLSDTLIAPTFPGIKRNYPKWVAGFLRETLQPSAENKKRRLYVTRSGGSRKVANEDTIRSILAKNGFEIYNPMENKNPKQDFAESSIIIGAHGAGLTDIVFCQPNTQILEFLPSDHVYPYFYSISQAASLRYGYILCPSLGERKAGAFGPSPFDFTVPESELENALKRIFSEESY